MENDLKNSFRSGYSKGLGFGLFLMLVGVVFLGLNFGFIPQGLRHVLISWQMLLIVIGVWNCLKRQLFSGAVLLLTGTFFIVPRVVAAYPAAFPGIHGNFTQIYWPLLLIAAGVLVILGKILGPKWCFNEWRHEHPHHHQHQRYSHCRPAEGSFSRNSVFGSGEHIVLDPEFKGGEMNAVFGGITLDLRRTSLPEGETILEVNAVFGGITIYAPADWRVESHLDTVFGGFQDNRLPMESADKTRKLIITGSCVFGGGEIRS